MVKTTVIVLGVIVLGMLSTGCTTFKKLQSAGVISSYDGQPKLNLLAVKQMRGTDCGVACLAGVMTYWGTPISQETIKGSLGKPPRGGYTLAQLRDYSRGKGFEAFVLQGSYDLIQHHCSLGRPCIIVLKKGWSQNHSIVVVKVTETEGQRILRAMDPANGKLSTFRWSEIDSRWELRGRPLLLIGRKAVIE
jgi:ABC-type bacteriocin/lantibiotic exporter with double-glycine peptidase domain